MNVILRNMRIALFHLTWIVLLMWTTPALGAPDTPQPGKTDPPAQTDTQKKTTPDYNQLRSEFNQLRNELQQLRSAFQQFQQNAQTSMRRRRRMRMRRHRRGLRVHRMIHYSFERIVRKAQRTLNFISQQDMTYTGQQNGTQPRTGTPTLGDPTISPSKPMTEEQKKQAKKRREAQNKFLDQMRKDIEWTAKKIREGLEEAVTEAKQQEITPELMIQYSNMERRRRRQLYQSSYGESNQNQNIPSQGQNQGQNKPKTTPQETQNGTQGLQGSKTDTQNKDTKKDTQPDTPTGTPGQKGTKPDTPTGTQTQSDTNGMRRGMHRRMRRGMHRGMGRGMRRGMGQGMGRGMRRGMYGQGMGRPWARYENYTKEQYKQRFSKILTYQTWRLLHNYHNRLKTELKPEERKNLRAVIVNARAEIIREMISLEQKRANKELEMLSNVLDAMHDKKSFFERIKNFFTGDDKKNK